jgi:hypothetical protein
MTLAATFLAGAKSRLLPASIPFRFFATAAVLHVAMWLVLTIEADEVISFRGGLGPALAALHLLTLGVLATTAMGAAAQLLPVATRRALIAVWPMKLVFWLGLPGIVALVCAMYVRNTGLLVVAGVLVTLSLLAFAAVLADNLRRAAARAIVAAYGWGALTALLMLVGLGLLLALDYLAALLPDHPSVALAHLVLGGAGFMGLLALGFSHVLIPMFTLASAPPRRPAVAAFVIAVTAVLLGTFGALVDSRTLLTAALFVGTAAAASHLTLMVRVQADGMRKRLGLSFVLVRFAWLMMLATPIVGLAALYGFAGSNGATLFGFVLLVGWLLTFLLGILQRILPFLASMHVGREAGAITSLADSPALKVHAACHCAALVLVGAAIVLDHAMLARLGGATGLVGAAAFASFTVQIVQRLRKS